MCLTDSRLHPLKDWNWGGDQIVYQPIIPKTRQIVGRRKLYDVDIREFLTFKDNAVIKRELKCVCDKL